MHCSCGGNHRIGQFQFGSMAVAEMRDPRTAVVMLGRGGDVLNISPWLHHLSTHGRKPVLIVAEQFANIAWHIPYIDVDVWHGDYKDCIAAAQYAKSKYAKVQDGSVYGTGLVYQRKCPHFCMEMWRRAGGIEAESLFRISNGGHIRLGNFDEQYHASLLAQHIGETEQPVVLLGFSGHSSPLPQADVWQHMLTERLSRHAKVLDISRLQLRSMCDLVALYKKAHLLISIDSGPMHVAGAVPELSHIAFRNDGWGSDWFCGHIRGTCIRKINYSTATQERDDVVNFAEKFILNIHEQRARPHQLAV